MSSLWKRLFFLSVLTYFVISWLICSFSCFCQQFSYEVENIYENKNKVFYSVTLNEKKNHHNTIKICRLHIWKKRSILNENLNIHYIWQNKTMNFFHSFKEQRLIIVLLLITLYFFEATCLIIFLYLQYLGNFKFIASFFEGMTKIMKG